MMRQALSILLALALIAPAKALLAQDTTPIPELEEQLSNMDAEVERFLGGGPLLVLEQERSTTDEPTEATLVRARLLNLKRDTMISVVFRDGEEVQGLLGEVTDDAFHLKVGDKRRYTPRKLSFRQVQRLDYPGSPERLHEIPTGKRVEVLLVSGDRVRGTLYYTSVRSFTLSLENDRRRDFTFDEVVSVRKLGMPTAAKLFFIGLPCILVICPVVAVRQ